MDLLGRERWLGRLSEIGLLGLSLGTSSESKSALDLIVAT